MKQEVMKLLAKVVKIEAGVGNIGGWPPPCIGYIYQPKRPKRTVLKNK